MKKILLILCFLAFKIMSAYALDMSDIETKEVENFFNSYVNSANNYDDSLINFYETKAEIERVVLKPDGTKQSVKIPMERYKKELITGKKLAKLVNYKNRYINKKLEKISDSEYKIKTKRIPFKDKKGLNAEFVVKRTDNGLKISHEVMETTVQKFLKAK